MKRMLSTVFCSSIILMIVIPTHASQLLAQGHMSNSGTRTDTDFSVNVNGTIQAPLTVHIPAQTEATLKRLAVELMFVGYGVGLIASGTKAIINDKTDGKKISSHSDSSLEDGLRKRVANTIPPVSDPLLVDDEDDKPRKSCCCRLIRSPGVQQIAAGTVYAGCGFSLEFISRLFV